MEYKESLARELSLTSPFGYPDILCAIEKLQSSRFPDSNSHFGKCTCTFQNENASNS